MMKPLTRKDLSSLSLGTRLLVVDAKRDWYISNGEVVTVAYIDSDMIVVYHNRGSHSAAYYPERFTLFIPKSWMGCWLPKKESKGMKQ